MTTTIKLTAAQAMMRWLSVQMTEDGERFIEGVWAIFGHGNVAGIGEALHGIGKALPTCRGLLDRTGRYQHGYRRRGGAREPAAGSVHPRRRLRKSSSGSGLAADRG